MLGVQEKKEEVASSNTIPCPANEVSSASAEGSSTQKRFFRVVNSGDCGKDVKDALTARQWEFVHDQAPEDKSTLSLQWTVKAQDIDEEQWHSRQLVNHFKGSASLTTKAGLNRSLQTNGFWEADADYRTFFPICFDLRQPEEKKEFIVTFRLVKCQQIIQQFANENKSITTEELDTTAHEPSSSSPSSAASSSASSASASIKQAAPTVQSTVNLSIVYLALLYCESYIHKRMLNECLDNPGESESAADEGKKTQAAGGTAPAAEKDEPAQKPRPAMPARLLARLSQHPSSSAASSGAKTDADYFTEDEWYCIGRECVERMEKLSSKAIHFDLQRKQQKKKAAAAKEREEEEKKAAEKKEEAEKKEDEKEKEEEGKEAKKEEGADGEGASSAPVFQPQHRATRATATLSSSAGLAKLVSPRFAHPPPAAELLRRVRAVLPQLVSPMRPFKLLGGGNLWIVKPVGKSRGRGIACLDSLHGIFAHVRDGEDNFVVQKYIEHPLLVEGYKFDIRQWVLVTSLTPLTIFRFTRPYLRLSSVPFTLDALDELIHLTNNCVQCHSEHINTIAAKWNIQENMMFLEDFERYLQGLEAGSVPLSAATVAAQGGDTAGTGAQATATATATATAPLAAAAPATAPPAASAGAAEGAAGIPRDFWTRWQTVTQPAIDQIIRASIKCGREAVKERKNAFEIYGYDFMIDDLMNPWLIEINSAPCMEHTTPVTEELVEICVEDTLKVVVDENLVSFFQKTSPSSVPPTVPSAGSSGRGRMAVNWRTQLSRAFFEQQRRFQERSKEEEEGEEGEGEGEKGEKTDKEKSAGGKEETRGKHKGGMVCFIEADSPPPKPHRAAPAAEPPAPAPTQAPGEAKAVSPPAAEGEPSAASAQSTGAVSPSFYEQETILKETAARNTGHWRLIYRERVEQVQYNLQPGKLAVKGEQITQVW